MGSRDLKRVRVKIHGLDTLEVDLRCSSWLVHYARRDEEVSLTRGVGRVNRNNWTHLEKYARTYGSISCIQWIKVGENAYISQQHNLGLFWQAREDPLQLLGRN
jgi:hypothetical protein